MDIALTRSDSEIRDLVKGLKTPRDIADLLEIDYSVLVYHVFKFPPEKKYKTFEVPKKSGGVREIRAPVSEIKILQRKLSDALYTVFKPKQFVHGFAQGRSIVSNAHVHKSQRYVLNVDLKDFFPSINFARVFGIFKAYPFFYDYKVATILARICCDEFVFPQGAPTSPIVSNMICARMDSQLKKLAYGLKCWYSRYGDDITFSTRKEPFPDDLAFLTNIGARMGARVGGRLEAIISSNGFSVNHDKVRLQTRRERQEVTGLIVNTRPNVERAYKRRVRAMLHAWEKHGLVNAEVEFLSKYNHKYRSAFKPPPQFVHVLRGKIEFIGMVRGKADPTYTAFLTKFNALVVASAV